MSETAQTTEEAPVIDPAAALAEALSGEHRDDLETLVDSLPSGDLARAVSMLDEAQRSQLLMALSPAMAAYVLDQLAHAQAADLLEELPAEIAASIIDHLPSDEQADVLGEFKDREAQAIIQRMAPEEAEDARLLTQYKPETAGGLMVTEYLAFFDTMTVDDVLQDIRANAERYLEYDVQYVYVIDSAGCLRGVVRLRDLVLARPSTALSSIMIPDPRHVTVDADLDELEEFFDSNYFFGVPVVDADGVLVGVVRREAVEEARVDRADRELLRFGGIITGEEFRTMPTLSRAGRRLVFLTPNILLNIIAASVIAFFVDTIDALPYLAVFLPILSDMSGCSGNQAVAVSMRELTLGIAKPTDVMRTLGKEVTVGMVNGFLLGLMLMGVAYAYQGDIWLGMVVGAALMANSVIAVAIGGSVPLVLKRFNVDPAMASGPILTTITDLCGFFFALALATVVLL